MLKKHWKFISLMAIVCLALCIGAVATRQALDGEKEFTLDELPAAVKATILAEANGAPIQEIEMETENGKTVYEAEVIINGQEVEFVVAPDGTLLGKEIEDEDDDDADDDEEEVEISLDDVPAAVKATMLKEAAGAVIEEVVKETENGKVVYEAEFEADGQEVEIEVSPDGTLLEREIEKDDD
ncbi:MAG: PepSY-like domain-containing protein [Sedimentisphaerales bacterium]|nr:PepSY-like domain-containing protein [Sedimentisphaerales bacterium]